MKMLQTYRGGTSMAVPEWLVMPSRILRDGILATAMLLSVTACRGLMESSESLQPPAAVDQNAPDAKPANGEVAAGTASPASQQNSASSSGPSIQNESAATPQPLPTLPATTSGAVPAAPESPQISAVPPRASAEQKRTPDFSYRDRLLTEDTFWSGEVVVEGEVVIAPQTTLTIAAGTIIRFRSVANGAGLPVLLVEGRIQSNGSEQQPVIFTSTFQEPHPGDWQGVVLLGSEKRNLLTHTHITGAGTGLDCLSSTVTVKNCRFMRCGTGIQLQDSRFSMAGGGAFGCQLGAGISDSEADISEGAFFENGQGIAAARSSLTIARSVVERNTATGVYSEEGRIRIAASRIAVNGRGIELQGTEGTVTNSDISGNREYGIRLGRSPAVVSGNEIAGNKGVGVWVDDSRSVVSGNAISGNFLFELFNGGTEDFPAGGNWWGGQGDGDIAGRLFDHKQDAKRGRVYYLPVLQERPRVAP